MKATFKANELKNVLKDVVRVVPGRATNFQKYILIDVDAEDGQVSFTASSDSESLRRKMYDLAVGSAAIIDEPGTLLLPGKEFFDVVKVLDGDIEITTTGAKHENGVLIKSGKSKYQLPGNNPTLFTSYDSKEKREAVLTIKATILKKMIGKTVFATAISETRPVLQGVHLTISDGVLKAVATDSQRLSSTATNIENTDDAVAVLPRNSLESLVAMLPNDDDEEITLAFGQTSVIASWGDDEVRYVMRVLDGLFPDVSRIIPTPIESAQFHRTDMLKALERVALFAEATESKRALFTFENNAIRISSESPTMGEATDEVEMVTMATNIMPMKFNIRYWIDALKALDSESVEVGVIGQNKPVVIRPVGESDDVMLVVPLMFSVSTAQKSA